MSDPIEPYPIIKMIPPSDPKTVADALKEYCSHDDTVIVDGCRLPLVAMTQVIINRAQDIRSTDGRIIKSRTSEGVFEQYAREKSEAHGTKQSVNDLFMPSEPDLELIADDIYASMTAMVSTGNLSIEQLMRLMWAASDNLTKRHGITELNVIVHDDVKPTDIDFVVAYKDATQYVLGDNPLRNSTKWDGDPLYFTEHAN